MDDDSKRFSAVRSAELGQVNQAFMTSIDDGEHHRDQNVTSVSPDGKSDLCRFVTTNCHGDSFGRSSSPVANGNCKEGGEVCADCFQSTDGSDSSFVDGKSGNCFKEGAISEPYGETPCQTSQPNQPDRSFDINPNNSTSQAFDSLYEDSVKSTSDERMENGHRCYSQARKDSPALIKQEGTETVKGVPHNEFTAIDLGHHKGEIQDGGSLDTRDPPCDGVMQNCLHEENPGDSVEIKDLNVSVRSDATEFFYTQDISPTRSPSRDLAGQKRGVTFSEKSIEIGEDMLETSFDHNDDVAFTEERIVGCLDQEYLRRMVDPNSRFFVRTT